VDFTITITNHAPEPVTVDAIVDEVGGFELDVTQISDVVIATGCAPGVVLAAAGQTGDSHECTFTLLLENDEPATIDDTVTVTGSDDDGNTTEASDDATVDLTAVADLAIDKEAPEGLTVGQTGVYTLTVGNAGPSTAKDVVVADVLPESLVAIGASGDGWTCAIGDAGASVLCGRAELGVGEQSTITLTVAVTDPGVGVDIENTATVDSDTPDPNPDDNSDTEIVAPTRVLGVQVTAPASLPKTGSNIRDWIVLADVALISGVALLLAELGPRRRRRIGRA
jgi:uncharacterized repeat protein (TIGR01451 family)